LTKTLFLNIREKKEENITLNIDFDIDEFVNLCSSSVTCTDDEISNDFNGGRTIITSDDNNNSDCSVITISDDSNNVTTVSGGDKNQSLIDSINNNTLNCRRLGRFQLRESLVW
jgi:hypothetical protein